MKHIACQLKITEFNRDDFLKILDHFIETEGIRNVVIAQPFPKAPENEHVELYENFVFDIPLLGKKHLICGKGAEMVEHSLVPGEVLFCPPKVWKLPVWDSAHELFCLVFTKALVRCTYIDFTCPASGRERPVCNNFYHTCVPPTPLLNSVLNSMSLLGKGNSDAAVAVEMTRALFYLTRDFVAKDAPEKMGKAEKTFRDVQHYLYENFHLPLTRESTARHFRINPSYLSRLFRNKANKSFSGYLREIRMRHALFLLRETDFLIDRITVLCGYQSTTFFTSAFKHFYGLPPGKYRLRLENSVRDSLTADQATKNVE